MTSALEQRDSLALIPYREFDEFVAYRFQFSTLIKLLDYLFKQTRYCTIATLCMVVATILSLAAPYFLGRFVELVLIKHDQTWVPVFVLLWILIESIRLLATIFENYFFAYVGQRVLHDLRVELYAHILRLPLAKIAHYSSGKLLARVLGDTSALAQMFTAGVIRIIEKAAVILCIICSLFILNWSLALISLVLFPLLGVVSFYLSRTIYIYQRKARLIFAGVTSFVGEAVSGKKVIASLNIKNTLMRRFSVLNAELTQSQFNPAFLMGVVHGMLSIVIGSSVSILLVVGGGRVTRGEMAVGDLVTFVTYVVWMFWPILHMVNQWSTIVTGLASAERLFEVLEWPIEDVGKTEIATSAEKKGAVRFEGVWFAYTKEEWVLKDISFSIRQGEKIGIVGATGSGKSTIIALLLRFYVPQRGTIFFDDVDIQSLTLDQLRHAIGVVEQSGALFEGTVEDNLKLGNKNSYVVDALVEQRKPGFLKRAVESGGKNLSAGERQLATFARILARSPQMWVLDEATAHVDAELDKELNQLAFNYTQGKTLLVIAHRLSSVLEMDRILVVNDGVIVEAGSHQELQKLGGMYAQLWANQNKLWTSTL